MQDTVVKVGKGKQIVAERMPVKAVYRFFGREIYLKSNTAAYDQQLFDQIKAKGGKVDIGAGWIRADIFGDNEEVKLGGITFNPKTLPTDEITMILFNFFKMTLENQGFKLEVSDI